MVSGNIEESKENVEQVDKKQVHRLIINGMKG
jgi:hypothetical protein